MSKVNGGKYHEWIFSANKDKDPKEKYRTYDTMNPIKRKLLNDHLDGVYTKDELKLKLKELKEGL